MKKLKHSAERAKAASDQSGFVTLIIGLIILLVIGIVFVYLRVSRLNS